jgi:hypothetical protein
MSHSYSISVPINIALSSNFIQKVQSFKIDFTLLEILPKETMQAMLKKELFEQGFTKTENDQEVKRANNLGDMIFNLDTMQLELSLNLPSAHAVYFTDDSNSDTELASVISNCIKNEIPLPQDISHHISTQFAEKMTKMAIEAKKIVNKALKNIYKESVIEKANEMGNLVNISESESNGSYKVHIEIQN